MARAACRTLLVAAVVACSLSSALAIAPRSAEKVFLDPLVLLKANRYTRSTELNHDEINLPIRALGQKFELQLKPRYDILTPDVKIVAKERGQEIEFDFSDRQIYHGAVNGQATSYVHVRVALDGTVSGAFLHEDVEYTIEPLYMHGEEHTDSANHVVYRADDVFSKPESIVDQVMSTKTALKGMPLEPDTRSRRAAPYEDGKDTCGIAIIIDYEFFNNVGSSSIPTAMDKALARFTVAKDVFEGTSFTKPVKLKVSFLTVLTEIADDPYRAHSAEGQWFLGNFSKTNWEDYCLAHIVTDFDFPSGLLGLAWVGDPGNTAGGICQDATGSGSNKLYTNTGFSTSTNFGNSLSTLMSGLVMSHEFGHNFGSTHDETQPATGGRYLMYPVAVSGSQPNNDNFSPESIDLISAVVEAKGGCFTTFDGSDCGNAVIEYPEECDCGTNLCPEVDSCCRPFSDGSPNNCKLKSGNVCSPLNPQNGTCCTSGCQYETVGTPCRNATECRGSSDCEANGHCPIADAYPDTTVCNSASQLCSDGDCVESICSLWNLEETEQFQSCEVFCLDNGTPKGIDELGAPSTQPTNATGSPYTFSGPVLKPPGSACMFVEDEPGSGLCDENGECTEVPVNDLLDQLEDILNDALNKALDWLNQTDAYIPNWAWVTIGAVVLVIIIIITCVCSNRADKRRADKARGRRKVRG